MTILQALHHEEQMEAAREEFESIWAVVVRKRPDLNRPLYRCRGWYNFLDEKNLHVPKPPTKP